VPGRPTSSRRNKRPYSARVAQATAEEPAGIHGTGRLGILDAFTLNPTAKSTEGAASTGDHSRAFGCGDVVHAPPREFARQHLAEVSMSIAWAFTMAFEALGGSSFKLLTLDFVPAERWLLANNVHHHWVSQRLANTLF